MLAVIVRSIRVFTIHLLCRGKQLGLQFGQRAIGIEAGIFRHSNLGLGGGRFVRLPWFLRGLWMPRRSRFLMRGPHRHGRTRARRVERPGQFLKRLREQLGQARRRIDRLACAERTIQRRPISVVGIGIHD